MHRMKSSPAELVVGSSQDLDDDMSDVEEVFIRDGKSGKSREIENKPLMPTRKKYQHKNSKTTQQLKILKKQYKRSRCSRCLEPFCYALLVLLIVLILSAIVLTLFPVQKLKLMFQSASPNLYQALLENNFDAKLVDVKPAIEKVPCQNMGVTKVWSRTFAKLNSEAPVRKTDLDGDGIDDIIVGFGVDDSIEMENSNDIPQCTMSRGQMDLCEGGVLALNGASGDVMWKFWSSFAVFSLFCKFDINNDRTNDCIVSGPGGLLVALDGKSGRLLWEMKEFNMQSPEEIDVNSVDLYTVNLMRDLDSDGIPDIIGAHTDERFGIRQGHIRLISGKTGKIIRSIPAPYKEEIFVPVQIIMAMKDGTEFLLVLTGGQNTAGGVYKIRLDSLKNFQNDNDYTTIQRSSSGFLVPAILTDLTGDHIDDFVVSSFNSTIYAFNGLSNALLWTYIFPSSETVSSIVPGLYNHDNVTDFMVKYSTGPGFPIYYYSQTTILNGINGESFLDGKITDSGGPHSLLGGVSIGQTYGGDFFFHFQSHCRDKFENAKDPYKFVPDSDIIQQSRADICMLRYNTSTVVKLNAVSRHVEPPGAVIFTSDDISLQLNQSENSKTISLQMSNIRQPLKHPKMRIKQPQNQNRFQPQPPIEVNKKQSNINVQHQQIQQQEKTPEVIPKVRNEPSQIVINEGQKQKALKFREKQLNLEVAARREKMRENGPVMEGFEDAENGGNFNDIMNKISMMDIPRQYKMNPDEMLEQNANVRVNNNEGAEKPADYDYYDVQPGQRYMQSMRRNWNPNNNRGVRSGDDYETGTSAFETLEKTSNTKKQDGNSQIVKKVLDDSEVKKSSQPMVVPRAETLWDIEIEKENNDNHKIRRRRSSQLLNQNILPSVSSTGVLVESLNKTNSTIDFVFVLNVRESESFPPLLLQSDVKCVEEKMASLGSFPQASEIIEWQKNFLKDCLKARLLNLQSQEPLQPKLAYETQITIIRLSITCTCNEINPEKEVCSTFKPIKEQRWTEYMGNQLDGTYSN